MLITTHFAPKTNSTLFQNTKVMETLKYTVIKSREQYNHYCQVLENLVEQASTPALEDEIALLTVLIEKYDAENSPMATLDPIALIKHLMVEHQLKAKDMVDIMGVSKGMVSDILNKKKGMSKEVIRKVAAHFALSQEALNKPYDLIGSTSIFWG